MMKCNQIEWLPCARSEPDSAAIAKCFGKHLGHRIEGALIGRGRTAHGSLCRGQHFPAQCLALSLLGRTLALSFAPGALAYRARYGRAEALQPVAQHIIVGPVLHAAQRLCFGSSVGNQDHGNVIMMYLKQPQRACPVECGYGIAGKNHIDLIAQHSHIVVAGAHCIPGDQKPNAAEFA
jgi:hypothetical protein